MISGEEVPNDILSQILQTNSGCGYLSVHRPIISIIIVAEKSVDMETLVDDFVTFYVAGRWH